MGVARQKMQYAHACKLKPPPPPPSFARSAPVCRQLTHTFTVLPEPLLLAALLGEVLQPTEIWPPTTLELPEISLQSTSSTGFPPDVSHASKSHVLHRLLLLGCFSTTNSIQECFPHLWNDSSAWWVLISAVQLGDCIGTVC